MIQHTKSRSRKQEGFTLIELMLAMAFVSFMLIFVVFATIEVMGNYNKGVAVKEINQTARTIVEEMTRLVRSTDGGAINTSKLTDGRICFGGISYVWNVRGAEGDPSPNLYVNDDSLVTMARVEDASGALCGDSLPKVIKQNSTSLLEDQVWVQDMLVEVSSNLKLVNLNLRLSTAGDNAPTVLGPSGYICEGGRPGNYCAVTEFSTTVSTRNGGN